MDARDTPEQAELRRTRPPAGATSSARGPWSTSTTASAAKRLAEAVRDAGWLELRHDGGDGAPLASGVEAAIIADALGRSRRRRRRSRARSSPPTSRAAPALRPSRRRGGRLRARPDRRRRGVGPGHDDTDPRRRLRRREPRRGLRPGSRRRRLPPRAGAGRRRRQRRRRSHANDPQRSRPGRPCSRFPISRGSSRAPISTPGPRSAWRSRAPT